MDLVNGTVLCPRVRVCSIWGAGGDGNRREINSCSRGEGEGWPQQGHIRRQPPLFQPCPPEGAAGVGLALVSVSSGTPRCVVLSPVCPQSYRAALRDRERQRKKKENNLTPNLFKGSQRPDVPCFLPAAAAVAIACGCGLSVWSSDVRDWNSTGNSPQLGGCSSAAAPDSRACKDPVLSQSQRLCFCWARVADVQKRCSALKI